MLILFSILSLIYLAVRKKRGDQLQKIFQDLGWLRYRSGSILPGWVVHSLINALGLLIMLG